MKYIITGLHCSGKDEIVRDLRAKGFKVGKNFISADMEDSNIYYSNNIHYENTETIKLFESQAYIYMNEISSYNQPYYEGLSLYEFNKNDIFTMSPNNLISIPCSTLANEELCFIWLDNNRIERKSRYNVERRKYDFDKRESIERECCDEFIDKIYSFEKGHTLYFNNEDPLRVSAVLQAVVKHKDMLEVFEERFN